MQMTYSWYCCLILSTHTKKLNASKQSRHSWDSELIKTFGNLEKVWKSEDSQFTDSYAGKRY